MKIASIALIAALAATPAYACTDWKAVAAFDALILENDRIAVAEERSPDAAPWVEKHCNTIKGWMEAEKDPVRKDKRMTQWKHCHGAETAYQYDLANLSLDRDHAIADTCQENAR